MVAEWLSPVVGFGRRAQIPQRTGRSSRPSANSTLLELDPLELDVARGYLAIGLPLGPAGLTINQFVARRYVATRRRHAERSQGGLRSVRRLLG